MHPNQYMCGYAGITAIGPNNSDTNSYGILKCVQIYEDIEFYLVNGQCNNEKNERNSAVYIEVLIKYSIWRRPGLVVMAQG